MKKQEKNDNKIKNYFILGPIKSQVDTEHVTLSPPYTVSKTILRPGEHLCFYFRGPMKGTNSHFSKLANGYLPEKRYFSCIRCTDNFNLNILDVFVTLLFIDSKLLRDRFCTFRLQTLEKI